MPLRRDVRNRRRSLRPDCGFRMVRGGIHQVVTIRGHDLSFVLPLTGKPDASDTKIQTGRES